MAVANNLAYYNTVATMDIKSFTVQVSGFFVTFSLFHPGLIFARQEPTRVKLLHNSQILDYGGNGRK